MKIVTKAIAVVASAPIAGLIILSGAGAANAITCGPGYTESIVNNTPICVPNSDGGVGGGGTGTIGNGGSTAPGQAVPIAPPVQQAPPAPAPAPAPPVAVPPPAAPAPAPNYAPSPSLQLPAAPTDSVDVPAVSDTPVGAMSPEIVKSEVPKTSESDAAEEISDEDKSTSSSTLVALEPGTRHSSATASPSPSNSPTESTDPSLEASRASDSENSSKSLPGLLIGLGVVLIALLTWCIIKIRQSRSTV